MTRPPATAATGLVGRVLPTTLDALASTAAKAAQVPAEMVDAHVGNDEWYAAGADLSTTITVVAVIDGRSATESDVYRPGSTNDRKRKPTGDAGGEHGRQRQSHVVLYSPRLQCPDIYGGAYGRRG